MQTNSKNNIRFFSALLMILLSFTGLTAQVEEVDYERLIKPDNAVFYNVPIGLCEDYPEETTSMDIIRNDFEFLKKNGINLLRISFGWDAIEAQEDKYDWLFWDDFVKMAVEEYQITLVPYVCYMPQWNSTGAKDTLFFWNYPPEDYQEFGEFMGDLVNRYKPWINSWELWNEPDISIYWQGTVEQFAKFIKIGSEAVRKADSDAVIVLGGMAYRPDFVRQLFRDHGVSKYVDVVNFHNYYETWSNIPIERITDSIYEMYDVIQTYGNGQAIWIAEVGYSTWRMDDRKVSDSYIAYYDYEHSPEYQAVHIVKTLSLLLSTEKISAIAWYEIKDLPMQENVIGDNNNRNLGVAYYDHKPKPATQALTFFNKLFSGKYRSGDDKVIITSTAGSESVVHSFEMEDGSWVITAWLKTTDYADREKDHNGNIKDNRLEKIDLTLPIALKGKVIRYDELGNTSDMKVNRDNNTLVINDLELKGGKIVILKVNK